MAKTKSKLAAEKPAEKKVAKRAATRPLVLVTGGAGYVGSVVVRELLEHGYRVRVLDSLLFTSEALREVRGEIQMIEKDIRDVSARDLTGVSAVIHLAGQSTDPTSSSDPHVCDLVNHIAAEKIARLAKAAGITRFVFASSASVYFSFSTPVVPPRYKESDAVSPVHPYALSKRAAEIGIMNLVDKTFRPVIFRKGTVYGFSPRMRYDLVLNALVKDAFYRKEMSVDVATDGKGQVWRPLLDIQDAARAYREAIELPLAQVGGKTFNVCSQNWSVGGLAKEIQKFFKRRLKKEVKITYRPVGIKKSYLQDFKTFEKTFKFKPVRPMSEAISELIGHLEDDPGHNPFDARYYNDSWLWNGLKKKV